MSGSSSYRVWHSNRDVVGLQSAHLCTDPRSMRDSTCIETPLASLASPEFLGGTFPSLEYSLDMLSEFHPQQPSDFFVPTTTAPLDFVSDLFPLPSISAAPPAQPQASAELPESPPANQALSSSSSGQSPGKERKGSRERQATGRWSTRDKGPVSETRKLEVNREAQRRFRQRQKVLRL